MKKLLVICAALAVQPALAGEPGLIRFDDAAAFFPVALGKQVDIRFSESFAKGRLDKTDFDAVVLSQMPEGLACFFGAEQGLDATDPRLADVKKGEANDICVPRGEVSVRASGAAVEGAPIMPFYNTVKGQCAWIWKTGRGIGLWTEDCKFENGHWSVSYNEAQDHFALDVDGGEPFPVLRQFRVGTGQGPADLLPELKAKGLVLNDAECVFAPSTEQLTPAGWSVWQVVPRGERKKLFESQPSDEVPEPPCGELGFAVDYIGFFMIHKDHAGRVLYVNLGQDGTMIDPFSVRLD